MADIRLVCVRDDMGLAEALGETLDAAGYSIDDDPEGPIDDVGAGLLLLSNAALASPVFRVTAQQVIGAHKAVVVNLTGHEVRRVVGNAEVIDFADWDGDADAPEFHALTEALARMLGGEHEEEAAPAPTPPPVQQRAAPPPPPVVEAQQDYVVTTVEDDDDDAHEQPRKRRGGIGGAFAGVVVALLIAGAVGAFGYYKLGLGAPAQTVSAPVAEPAATSLARITPTPLSGETPAALGDSINRVTPMTLATVAPAQSATPARAASTQAATPPRRQTATPRPRTNWDTTNPAAPTRRGPPT